MYVSVDDIRAASTRITAINDASDTEIELWGAEAGAEIETFCAQDFLFEVQRTKKVRVETSLVHLPKSLSGYVSVTVTRGDLVSGDLGFEGSEPFVFPDAPASTDSLTYPVPHRAIEFFHGENYLVYKAANVVRANTHTHHPDWLTITGDWGYASTALSCIIASANEIKTQYAAHRVDLDYHVSADVTNTVAAADATGLASSLTLLNELKTKLNLHFANATAHSVADPNVIVTADATDELTAIDLAVDILITYNSHLKTASHIEEDTENIAKRLADSPVIPAAIRVVYTRLVQRLAVRSSEDDFSQMNMGYGSETDGDGYNYSLHNPTLRNLIQPSEFRLLWPYINHGQVVA